MAEIMDIGTTVLPPRTKVARHWRVSRGAERVWRRAGIMSHEVAAPIPLAKMAEVMPMAWAMRMGAGTALKNMVTLWASVFGWWMCFLRCVILSFQHVLSLIKLGQADFFFALPF